MNCLPRIGRRRLAALALFAALPVAYAQEAGDAAAAEDEPPRGLRTHEAGAVDGYTLIAPLQSDRVYLVGLDGDLAHEWKTDYAPGGGFYLLADGHLLRCGRQEDNPLE